MTQLPEPISSVNRCPLCGHHSTKGTRLCKRHADELTNMIDPGNVGDPDHDVPASIPILYELIDLEPGASGDDTRRPPGFVSTPPTSLHLITLRDDRSHTNPCTWYDPHPSGIGDNLARPHTEEPHPPRPIRIGLHDLVARMWDHGVFELCGPLLPDGRWLFRHTVADLSGMLHVWRDRLLALPEVVEAYRDLVELSDQTRRAAGDAPLGPEGWCIKLVRDRHGQGYRECGGPLTLGPPKRDPDPPEGETPEQERERHDRDQRKEITRCPRCHSRYSWLDLIRIKYVNTAPARRRTRIGGRR